jgi:hypothetical protein
MNNIAPLILRKIVIRPGVTYDELCLESRPKIETKELSQILDICGIQFNDSRQALLFERWNWEGIVFQRIYQSKNQPAKKWFDGTVEALRNNGLSEYGARQWLGAYLTQLYVRWDDRDYSNFEHDLKMLSDISNDKDGPFSNHDASLRSFARFIARAGLNLIVGYSPEVVRSWINSPSQNRRLRDVQEHAAAWVTYALGSAYPFVNSNERLVGVLMDTARDYIRDFGFDKLENTDLFYMWFENSSQKADSYLAALRRICPHLLRTGNEYLRENTSRWKDQWYSICVQRPSWQVKRSGIFAQDKSGAQFLETVTLLPDRLDQKRLFSWRLMSLFINTLIQFDEVGDNSDQLHKLKHEIQSRWRDMPPLTDDVVAKHFHFHEYDDARKVSILQKLLTGKVIDRSELDPKDRSWLLRQVLVQLILEAMLLDIRLDNDFYGKIKHQLAQLKIGDSIFSAIPEHEISKAFEVARDVLGISEQSPYPSGIKPWREWVQQQNFVKSPLAAKLQAFILEKRSERSFVAQRPSNSDTQVEFNRVREEIIKVAVNKTDIVRTLLNEIDQTIKRLNNISFPVENDTNSDQLAQYKGAIAYWQSENQMLQIQFQQLKENAVLEFIKSWNGEKSKDSSLNQLYMVSRSDSGESAEIAQDMLQRFRNVGVKPYKTDLVGTIIELTADADNEWLLAPGTTMERYNGQAYVLTPEWRYFDFIIEKSWITLPNK